MQTPSTRKSSKGAPQQAQRRGGSGSEPEDYSALSNKMDSLVVTQENGDKEVGGTDDASLNTNARTLNGNNTATAGADEVSDAPAAAPPPSDTTSQQDGDVLSHLQPLEDHHPLHNHPHHPHPPLQKRVLPARQRRGGGPGLGNCSIDQLILETEKRTREGRPAIPVTQSFLLTTNPRMIPPPKDEAPDGDQSESYFDKPEVKAAYLAQKAIQVPEFCALPDDNAVGGRLRARAPEEGPGTQDAAYIKRHQKYETFEKRQRRREKEKLMHEHYKLKERIDQLKGMDATVFGTGGDTRRKEMLDVAINLESRYTLLLPPEPRRPNKKVEKKRREVVRTGTTTGDDADTEDDAPYLPPPPPVSKLTATKERTAQTRSAAAVLQLHPPQLQQPRQRQQEEEEEQQQSPIPPSASVKASSPLVTVAYEVSRGGRGRGASRISPDMANEPPKRESTRISAKQELRAIHKMRSMPEISQKERESLSPVPVPPPRKRMRTENKSKVSSHTDYFERPNCVILQVARRKAAQDQFNARQTTRVIHGFGYPVPQSLEEEMYFELPESLITQDELEDYYARKEGAVSDGDPPYLGQEFFMPSFKQESLARSEEPSHPSDDPVTIGPLLPANFAVNGAADAMDLDDTVSVPVMLDVNGLRDQATMANASEQDTMVNASEQDTTVNASEQDITTAS